jgi:DNA-binding transcriptional regulator YiaG
LNRSRPRPAQEEATMTEDAPRRLVERGALLIRLLHGAKRQHQRRILIWGGLGFLGAVTAGLAVWMLLAASVPAMPRIASVVLALCAWAGAGSAIWKRWVRPLQAIPNLAVFSRLVEERRDFRDLLRAGLEFSARGAPTGGESVDLVAATVDRAYDEARALQLTRLFEFTHRRRDAALLLAGTVVALATAWIQPAAPARAWRGLLFDWPQPGDERFGELEATSGDLTILAGGDAEVAVRERGPRSPEVFLRFNDTGDLWKSRPLQPSADAEPRDYVFRFEDVRSDLTYRFENGRRRTAEHRIRVVQRPIVSHLQLRLVPPAYTGRTAEVLEEGRGDAMALLGTRVEISARSSSGLAAATLIPERDAAGLRTLPGPQPMTTAGKDFSTALVIKSDIRYHFDLMDSLGHRNTDAIVYQIGALEDRPPYVEVRAPGDADLPKSMQVEVVVHGSDDYGLSRMTLAWRREKSEEPLDGPWIERRLELRGEGSTDAEGQPLAAGPVLELLKTFHWNLAAAGLFPGDFVEYYVEVEDNDAVSGHKTARTPVHRLRLQSLTELYADIQSKDGERLSQMQDAIEKSKQLQEKYAKLARELKKTPEVDWKKEKEIEGALEKQKQVSEQVQKIAEQLDQQIEKLQSQDLMSQEILQKMDEIRKLLEQTDNQAMRDYMQKLQEAMKQISPEEIQRAMEQMQVSQEEFLKRLERTKALLEQLQREQRLDEMIEKMADLLQNQEQLGRETEELTKERGEQPDSQSGKSEDAPKSAEELAREQQELAQEAKELQEKLDQLAQESEQAGQQQLQEVNQQMQQENPSSDMQDASQQLQQQRPQQAQPHQEKAERSLRALYQELMQAQSMMSMQGQAEAAAKLAEAARRTLDVSFRQEGLTRQSSPGGTPQQSGDLAQQQQALAHATGRVVEELDALAQKSMAAPPQVNALLGQALRSMRSGVEAYEKGNSIAGRVQGEEAYGLLNRAVVELNRSSSASCPKPGGGKGASQSMEQLMGQQQQLNDATRRMQQSMPNSQQLTPEQRAQMSRLLGEQRAIEGQLQDLERQAAEQRELLGRLDKMQDEMREVVEDLQSESLTEETLRMQERIVSRMLDAQRSLHKRDFNEERESRSAADIFSQGGKPLPANRKLEKLRRDVERALRDATPEEYEDLVRQYFRAISEAEGATPPQPTP